VSIVFGFLLVVLCVAGLCFYIYIFYRKRRKHLRKKKRMMAMGIAMATMKHPSLERRPQAGPPPSVATAAVAAETPGKKSDDSSYGSPEYDGLDSDSEGDVFAKELKIAATLDRKAWEDFVQRKTQYEQQKLEQENVTEVHIPSTQTDGVRLYGAETTEEGIEALHADSEQILTAPSWLGLELVNSFPYGDEIPNTLSNLTPDDLLPRDDNPNGSDFLGASLDWARKSASNDANSGAARQHRNVMLYKEEDDPTLEDDLLFHLAQSKSQDTDPRNLQPGGNEASAAVESRNEIEDERIDPETDDMIKEVQRLSQFVKKYEKKKEKRTRRVIEHQQQLQSLSSFEAGADSHVGEHAAVGKQTHLHDTEESGGSTLHHSSLLREAQVSNARSGLRSMAFSKYSTHEGSDESQEGGEDITPTRQTDMRGRAVGGIYLTDGSSDSDTDDDEDFFRLGITPFSVQKPSGPSPERAVGSRAGEAALQSINQGTVMTDASEEVTRSAHGKAHSGQLGQQQPAHDREVNGSNEWSFSSPAKKQSLSALRFNESIIDNTNSEVPSSVVTPSEAATLLAASRTTLMSPPSGKGKTPPKVNSSKFANIVSMFEAKPKEAIFPPNESWQFNS
jgi:hypothetical protein